MNQNETFEENKEQFLTFALFFESMLELFIAS